TNEASIVQTPILAGVVGPPRQVVVADLPSPTASTNVTTLPSLSPTPDFAYSSAHYTPPAQVFVVNQPQTASIPNSSQQQGVTFNTGIQGLTETSAGGAVPPDVQVAVGPSHVVEMVNLAGEV